MQQESNSTREIPASGQQGISILHTLCNVAANKRLMILMMEGRKVMSASKQAIIIIISEPEH